MGFGKSTFSINLCKYYENKKINTLLIDFDFYNSSINTILGINKYSSNIKKRCLEDLIIRISRNMNVICALDLILKNDKEFDYLKINEIFKKLKEKYEIIIIDNSSNISNIYQKILLNSCDKNIFLIEPNLSEIKKAKNYLEIYIKDWNIDKNKIRIIFNKVNKYSICYNILEEIFSEFEIIGTINYNEKFNLFINKNGNLNLYNDYKEIYNLINFEEIKNEERRINNINKYKMLLKDKYVKRFIFRRKHSI